LNRPLPPAAPGEQASTFGPTAVQNLLSALSDLSNAQNNFMSVWLNYYAERMQLMRDLGLMQLDEDGRWIDMSLEEALGTVSCERDVLPPAVPEEWWDLHDQVPMDQVPEELRPAQPSSSPDDAAPELPPANPEETAAKTEETATKVGFFERLLSP
jgi:hypothetical protein